MGVPLVGMGRGDIDATYTENMIDINDDGKHQHQ